MKLWPTDRFEVETTMSVDDVVEALKTKIEPKRWFRLSPSHASFQGTISRDGFKITRIIQYRNSFLPIVTGRFLPGNSGIKVAIRLGLHPLVVAFLCVWFGGVGIAAIAAIFVLLTRQTQAAPLLLIPIGIARLRSGPCLRWILVRGKEAATDVDQHAGRGKAW
jgi:hypothetical protein